MPEAPEEDGPRRLLRTWRTWLQGALIGGAAAVVVLLFALFVKEQRNEAVAAWRGRLSATAVDREMSLTRWLTGRREDAKIIAAFPTVQSLAALPDGASSAEMRPHLVEILSDIVRIRHYMAAALVDGAGVVSAPQGGDEPIATSALDWARRVAGGTAGHFQSFVRGSGGEPLLVTVQPLEGAIARRAVVLLVSDPRGWIYPSLAMEPIPTLTEESALVQRDNGRVVYVSPLRLSAAPPLTLFSTDRRVDPAAWSAAAGVATFDRTTDYRGAEVFAATRPIPGTDWGLVVKVDLSEAMAQFRTAVALGAGAALLALGVLAAVVTALLSHRKATDLAATLQEREHYETRLRGLGRLYRTLSEVNQLLVRENDEAALLAEVCRIVVVQGGFRMAWVGLKEVGGLVRVAASAGEVGSYLDGVTVRWDDTPEGRGPSGTAVRENRPVVNHDSRTNPALELWRERVERAGYRSSAAIPILMGGGPIGVLTVYGAEPGEFDEERLGLLTELASDLGYSLGALRERAARQAAEQALRESEQRIALFMRQLPGVAVIRDPDGRYLFMNEAWEEVMGFKRADLLNKTPMDCFPESSAEELLAGDRQVLRTLEPVTHVVALQHKSGVKHWLAHHFPLPGPDGTIVAVGILYVDISDRIRAEEEVREREATFKTLAESAHTAIFVYRGDTFVYVNPEVERLTGFSAAELIGRSVLSVVDPGDLAMVRGRLEARRRGEQAPPRYEFRIVSKTGVTRWIDFTAAVCEFRGEHAVLCTAYEVTERKTAEAERSRLAAAIEQSGEAVILTDPDGTIRYVNPAFTRITGYTSAEALGANPRVLKSGQHDADFYRELWGTITSGRTWEGRIVNRRKDGGLYTEEMTISAVRDDSGKIVQFVAVKRDISAQLEMEAQLVQAQKMEAIGLLAGGVAHDFNNLLQAMMAALSLVRADTYHPERAFARLEEIEEQIRSGGALTRQLLLFARRETTRPEVFDLNQLVRDVARMLRRMVPENIAITVAVTADALPVEADRGQMEQVLVNLVVNAGDAMLSGGEVRISTWQRDGTVGLAVTDTGPGVPEEIRDRIFEPFFTTKEPGKGTGLGLSVVHGIVSRLGGAIALEAGTGDGATFTITLPRAGGALEDYGAPGRPMPVRRGRGERLLLVEDEGPTREALAEILRTLGYSVTAAASGSEAGTLPAAPGFDLLLTDLVLPDVSGLDLALSLAQRWPAAKVILMSGYSDNAAVRLAVAGGWARFLQKPFGIDVLARELRAALDD